MDPNTLATIVTGIAGAAATIVAAVIGVRVGRRPEKEDPKRSHAPEAKRRNHRYDVFVSSPLAGFATDEEILAEHERLAPVVDCLEKELGFSVFWAARNIRSKADFDEPGLSAVDDVEALKDSKYFMLFYPRRVVSSVLFEAGIALRSCLVSLYFVDQKSDLPFLMASASEVFANVRTYTETVPGATLALLRRNRRRLFEASEPSQGSSLHARGSNPQ